MELCLKKNLYSASKLHCTYVNNDIYFLSPPPNKINTSNTHAQDTIISRWVKHWNCDNDLTTIVLKNFDGAILVGIDFMPKHYQSLGSAVWLAPAWRRLVSGTAICFSCQRQQERGQDLEGEKLEKKLKSKSENEEMFPAKGWRLTEKMLQKIEKKELCSPLNRLKDKRVDEWSVHK